MTAKIQELNAKAYLDGMSKRKEAKMHVAARAMAQACTYDPRHTWRNHFGTYTAQLDGMNQFEAFLSNTLERGMLTISMKYIHNLQERAGLPQWDFM